MKFKKLVSDISRSLAENGVESTIKNREIPFLAMLGAFPTTSGCILEIGAFKGASTIALSKAARFAGDESLWTVDPFTSPCVTDPKMYSESSYPEFSENLKKTGTELFVNVFKGLSSELAKKWDRPIRVLWIDGDHTYNGAKQDFDLFSPFLSDGAIVAFHDVMTNQNGVSRVFNEVLLLENFCACGIAGTIGWAQYMKNPKISTLQKYRKMKLHNIISPHAAALAIGLKMSIIQKLRYNLLRNLNREYTNPYSFLNVAKWACNQRIHSI